MAVKDTTQVTTRPVSVPGPGYADGPDREHIWGSPRVRTRAFSLQPGLIARIMQEDLNPSEVLAQKKGRSSLI